MTDASAQETKQTIRLIERWLPIAEIGIESIREVGDSRALPAPRYLHVWWARRPQTASRAAIVASLMAHNAEKSMFMDIMGITGDPIAVRAKLDLAKRTGENLGSNPYGYPRAFTYNPSKASIEAALGSNKYTFLDATSGGGSIPFEALRLGLKTYANELNPVASILLKATLDFPARYGRELVEEFTDIAAKFQALVDKKCLSIYPKNEPNSFVEGFMWARTISCPHCDGVVPLSPNWKLSADGVGIRIAPQSESVDGGSERYCTFEVVKSEELHSTGTVSDGDGICPFADCGRPIDGDYIKSEAQAGRMGDQLFAIVTKRKVMKATKTGRLRESWVRDFRVPMSVDDNSAEIDAMLAEKIAYWDAEDVLPNEPVPDGHKTSEPQRYGMNSWRDLFNNRQLMAHGISVESFREMFLTEQALGEISEVRKAAYLYLALSIDRCVNYNSRMSLWNSKRGVMTPTFDRHDFAFKYSYTEMALAVAGGGHEWALRTSIKAIEELIQLHGSDQSGSLFDQMSDANTPIITVGSGAYMPHLEDGSVDCVVIDPPYGANVMYAELSDFFYVWLKRTAGLVMPEYFTQHLANKDEEAVANPARFKGERGAMALANRDYQDKMAGIFKECRRVLKSDGIMTVMFTHKDTGAWDALAVSLMQAGFVITASWPVNTESPNSMHIKDKAAANSTIFLVCRPRLDSQAKQDYWEDVESLVREAVQRRIEEFEAGGIRGVDLYLASFGPALEEFSRHWPLTRGTPAPEPARRRRVQADMFDTWDPYAVRPEDALNAARREVKAWRLSKLSQRKGHADLDPPTSWVALAWDAFRAPKFPYDEGLRLARAVGLDLETEIVGRVAEKKGSDLTLWDSATRVARAALGPADGARGMIDALHHAAHTARTRGVEAAGDMLTRAGLIDDEAFKTALEVMLEVLPPSRAYTGFDPDKSVQPAADDFDALEKIRRILFADEIDAPKQLDLFKAPEPVA